MYIHRLHKIPFLGTIPHYNPLTSWEKMEESVKYNVPTVMFNINRMFCYENPYLSAVTVCAVRAAVFLGVSGTLWAVVAHRAGLRVLNSMGTECVVL